ncbi:MAG: prephenate dehydrogenase/arogenate dehydrogenase family protein [Pseudomonadota bacterium]
MAKHQIGILGYGRFGRIMMRLLASDHEVFFYDVNDNLHQEQSFKPLQDLLKLPVLILAVPINQMETVLKQISAHLSTQTVIDVCSVKIYPTQLMLNYLPEKVNVIATHPMFGPDSYGSQGQKNMMMYPARVSKAIFQQWHDYFLAKDLNVCIMSPEQHDRESAFSQSLTHFLGRVLNEINLQDTDISTEGYRSLLKIVEQTCNDSWELFQDILQYNPYGETMIEQLNAATDNVVHKLKSSNQRGDDGK